MLIFFGGSRQVKLGAPSGELPFAYTESSVAQHFRRITNLFDTYL